MKTNNLFIITIMLLCLNATHAKSGGDGDGGGGPKITKGVFSRIIGDGDGGGGGGPKVTGDTYLISFGGEAGGGGGSSSGGSTSLSNVLIKSKNANYILESMNSEEVDYFLENYLTNEEILEVRNFNE